MKITNAENVLILISLLKRYGIRKIIASPGTMNICFIGTIQFDSFFEIYSAVDERSAAYMAVGMAAESGEPVCLSCTGATASRNYLPGLTEAYYRRLPIITITSTQPLPLIGHHVPQVIDRRSHPNDTVYYSTYIGSVTTANDRWECETEINKALIKATKDDGGPVHINLETPDRIVFKEGPLPDAKRIGYYSYSNLASWPDFPKGRIGVFVGSHRVMSPELEQSITHFCEKHDGVVFCDRTSNYFGKFRIVPGIVMKQDQYESQLLDLDLLIHIGEVSGSQYHFNSQKVWRVHPDGEIRDTFRKLSAVFGTEEEFFFSHYAEEKSLPQTRYLTSWKDEIDRLNGMIQELPFSNLWIAQSTIKLLPDNTRLYLGILNSLRSWDYFDSEKKIFGYANTGGFGIDGGVSSFVGGALSKPDELFVGIFGDLGFFYDMNVMGNRHFPPNARLLIINNGRGFEFRKYNHPGSQFGEDADLYMAAAGHFGNQSPVLLKHYAQDLGFDYIAIKNKEEYNEIAGLLAGKEKREKPIVVEAFVDYRQEDRALYMINHLEKDKNREAVRIIKGFLGEKGVQKVKKLIKPDKE